MARESRGGAGNTERSAPVEKTKKATRAKVVPARDFSKGREAAALKARIHETRITQEQAGPLREYVKLMDELDDAQKRSNKGSAEARKSAREDIKEIADLVAENKKDLKDAGLNVAALGLERKDNRKLLMRDRRDIFAPSSETVRSGKALLAPEQRTAAPGHFEVSADYLKTQMDRKEADLMDGFYADDFAPAADVPKTVVTPEARPIVPVRRTPEGRVIRDVKVDMRPISERPPEGFSELAPDVIDENGPKRKAERAEKARRFEENFLSKNVDMRPISERPPEGLSELAPDVIDEFGPKREAERAEKARTAERARGFEESFLGKDFDKLPHAPVAVPEPKSTWDRAKSWAASTPVGKAAKWLGVGLIGFLGMNVLGPRQDVESPPQQDEIAMTAPAPEAVPMATVSVDDANAEIGAPEATSTEPSALRKQVMRDVRAKGDPRNLEDALKLLSIFPGKAEYQKMKADEAKADLTSRLADLATVRSALSGRSPAVEASKRADMLKKMEDIQSHLELMRTIRGL